MKTRVPLVRSLLALVLGNLIGVPSAGALIIATPTATSTPDLTATSTPSPTPASLCEPAPAAGCRLPAVSDKAVFRLRDRTPDHPDRLIWKWLRGTTTPKVDFGSPTTTTDYELCVYDGNSTLISTERAPAGDFCGGKPCWTETSRGFKYRDGELTPDGVGKLHLTEGLEDGKAKIIIKGQRENLNMPTLPLVQPVRVQLVNSIGGCWEAVYSAPAAQNQSDLFKDKAD